MLIFDHWSVEIALILLLCLVTGAWLWRVVRIARRLVRLPLRAGSVLLVMAATLLLAMQGCGSVWDETTTAAPVYSPDRRHPISVRTVDSGALGGSTSVGLYSYGGLLEDYVAGGDWKIVEAQNVHWTSNSEVVLGYETSYRRGPTCVSTKAVHVVCVPSR